MESVTPISHQVSDGRFVSVIRVNMGNDDPKNNTTMVVPYNNRSTDLEKNCQIAIAENHQNMINSVNANDQPAVVMRNVKKRYGSKGPLILDNFCMTVQKGSIYSLLGSSGSGKTTALSCLIGIKQIDRGFIRIFGQIPGTKECGIPGKKIGLMPQEIALYHDFSIDEMIGYFATLYAMSNSEMNASKDLLINLLELPEGSRRIATLSGGQKRRCSLAVSLIHSPELLILDEPTVGVDALLRESIWKHLISLVAEKKTTVIITTHYIEEARQSQMVGLMRGGRLLIEKHPESLIQEYGATLLEEVVLNIYRKDKLANNNDGYLPSVEDDKDSLSINETEICPELTTCSKTIQNWVDANKVFDDLADFTNSMMRVKALATKNIIVMMRNLLLFVFLVLVPAMQITILSLTIGNNPQDLKMGFVNKEKVDLKNCLVPNNQRVCNVEGLSCNYLKKLPKDMINLISFETEDAARDAVKLGEIWGAIYFPEDYSQHVYARASGLALNGSLDASEILLEMDMSNSQIGITLQRVFYDTYKTYMSELLSSCGFPSTFGEEPIKYLTPIYPETDFSTFIAPSSLLSAVFFFSLCSSSISYIWDKKQGTLERGLVAGVQTWEIMTAFYLTEGCILVMQVALVFPLLVTVFGITIQGSATLALLLTVLMGFSGVSCGFLIGTFCNAELDAVLLAMASYFPSLPIALKYFSTYILPNTLANESMRSIVGRGWGFSHINVWPGFANIICWTSFYWMMTIYIRKCSLARK